MGSSLSLIMFSPSLLGSNWLFSPEWGGPGPASPLPADLFQEALDPGNNPFFCQALVWIQRFPISSLFYSKAAFFSGPTSSSLRRLTYILHVLNIILVATLGVTRVLVSPSVVAACMPSGCLTSAVLSLKLPWTSCWSSRCWLSCPRSLTFLIWVWHAHYEGALSSSMYTFLSSASPVHPAFFIVCSSTGTTNISLYVDWPAVPTKSLSHSEKLNICLPKIYTPLK